MAKDRLSLDEAALSSSPPGPAHTGPAHSSSAFSIRPAPKDDDGEHLGKYGRKRKTNKNE